MSQNPFETPKSLAKNPTQPQRIPVEVKGKLIGVFHPADFPLICPVSDQPISPVDIREKSLGYTPKWTLLFLLFGFLPFVILALILSKKLKISYGVTEEIRKSYFVWNLSKFFVFLFLVMTTIFVTYLELSDEIMITGIVLSAISFFFIFYKMAPLTLHSYRDGRFWVKGCGESFLNNMRAANR